MGAGWRTLLNRSAIGAPARWVGRIGSDPLRVGCLELAQLLDQLVVLVIADDRGIEHVVAIVVEMNFAAEVFESLEQIGIFHGGYYSILSLERLEKEMYNS